MNLSHFSDDPVERMLFAHQDGKGVGVYKPCGLWISVDGPDDWPSWCKDENFRDVDEQYRYAVHLAKRHRVLVLDTLHEMIAFNREYRVDVGFLHDQIDWARVAQDHDGVIIAPYHWDLRLENDFFWYYGWDCASGCIWHPRAVERLELIHAPQRKSEAA